jgi:hypothetical protein
LYFGGIAQALLNKVLFMEKETAPWSFLHGAVSLKHLSASVLPDRFLSNDRYPMLDSQITILAISFS